VSQILFRGTSSSGGPVVTLTGNDSVAVGPTAGNINIVGSGPISITGNAGTSTLTVALAVPLPIEDGGTFASSYSTVDGTVYYDGTRLVTTATGTTGFVLTSAGPGVAPSYQAVTASGAVTSVSGGNNITISGTATAPIVNVSGTTQHAIQIGNATNSLTSLGVGTTGQVLTGVTASDPVWASPAASSISITGDTGGALVGAAFTFTGGTTGLTFGGAGSTETLSGTLAVKNGGTGAATLTGVLIGNGTSAVTGNAITQYDVLVGGVTNAISSIAPSATTGIPLVSGGAAANPSFGTAVVAGGGTGNTTFTAYSLITAGTSATGAFQNVVGTGTTGQLLVAVTGGLPVWTNAGSSSSISITGDTGGALTGDAFTFSGGTTGLSFGGSGSTETLTFAGITANGGTVSLATDATGSSVNIGTGAGAKLVAIGSKTGASSITESVGTGNFVLDGVAGSTYTIGASTTTGTTTIGGTAQTGTITLGSSSGTNIVAVGAGAGATTVNIANGVSGNTISLGNGVNTSAQVVNIASGAAGANSTVNILNGVATTGTQTVNIATGAAASTTNIGNVTGASGIVERVGTGNYSLDGAASSTYRIGASTTTGTIIIGGTAQTGGLTVGSSSGTSILNLGTGGGANAVNVGVGGTGIVRIGNTTGNTAVTGSLTASTTLTATSGAITATSGNIVVTSGNITLAATTSSSIGSILIDGNSWLHAFGATADANSFVGSLAGNYTLTSGTATNNSGFGNTALAALTTGTGNTCIGSTSGASITTSNKNTAVGRDSLNLLTTGTAGAGYNCCLGWQAARNLSTGQANICLGVQAGYNYTGAESSNILIGYSVVGTLSESNVLRIGVNNGTSLGYLAKAFIQGISGVTVTGTAVLCATNGQLGTVASSRRFKDDIVDMTETEVIHKFRPVTFIMKNDPTKHKQWGLIAEEVQDIYPELVNPDENGDPYSVRYLDLIPMLLKEVQTLRKELDVLKGAQ
jgi:hypothetical protein